MTTSFESREQSGCEAGGFSAAEVKFVGRKAADERESDLINPFVLRWRGAGKEDRLRFGSAEAGKQQQQKKWKMKRRRSELAADNGMDGIGKRASAGRKRIVVEEMGAIHVNNFNIYPAL
jgi:hypothetical protein